MHQSINKKKIYFYLFIFFSLSTLFNLNFIDKINSITSIKSFEISGLNQLEEQNLKKDLNKYINSNILKLKDDQIINVFENYNYFENYIVKKIFPSKVKIDIQKTKFLARTITDGEEFYVGSNGKKTKSSLIEQKVNLPYIFGKFEVNDFLRFQELLLNNDFNLNIITDYYFFKLGRWDIKTEKNILIKFPSNNLESALKMYKIIYQQNLNDNISIIDLRVPKKAIITNDTN